MLPSGLLRSAGKYAGGVAVAGTVASSQRAQPPRHAGASQATSIGGEWLVADVLKAVDGDEVYFGTEEINSTKQDVMRFANASAYAPYPSGRSGVHIEEVAGEGEPDGQAADAEIYMHSAQTQMVSAFAKDFDSMLNTLLHSPDVQRACVKTLASNPQFRQIMSKTDTESINIPLHSLLPAAAARAEGQEHAEGNEAGFNFIHLVQNLANGIVHLGEVIKQKAIGARDLIGKLFIELGANLHALLGQPFGSTPLQESNAEVNTRAEMVGNALVTVACAILTMVLLKRAHHIQFV